MIYQMLYSISVLLHIWALYIGVLTVYKGTDTLFNKTCLRDLWGQNREMRGRELIYLATICGMSTNIFFIISKTGYILLLGGATTGVLEPVFVAGHLMAGFSFIVYHQINYEKVEGMLREENIG